jgi:hypothetical protein
VSDNQPIQFDLDTVLFLRETLDDAWACLRPAQRATTTRSELAERILKTAARGERNKKRLVDAAVAPIAA